MGKTMGQKNSCWHIVHGHKAFDSIWSSPNSIRDVAGPGFVFSLCGQHKTRMAVCFEYNTKSLMSMPAAENITVSRNRSFLFHNGGLVSWRFAEWIVAGMLNMLSLDLRVQTALSFFQQSDCIYLIICLVFWAVQRIHNLYRIPFSGGGKSMHKSALLFCETLLQAMEWSKAASVQQKSVRCRSATLEARTCGYLS